MPRYADRGYEHPVDVMHSPEGVNLRVSRSLGFELQPDQESFVAETLANHQTPYLESLDTKERASEGTRAIEAMTLLAVQGVQFRDTQERMALDQLGVDVDEQDSKYFELAGKPERLRDFVVWFDGLARDAIARQVAEAQSKEAEYLGRFGFRPIPDIEETKGIGLEIGSVVMGGLWQRGNGLWAAVDPLPDQIRATPGYDIAGPAVEVAAPTYQISPAADRDFLNIKREVGIWDILTPGRERIYVAHRVMGLVALNHIKNDDLRRSLRRAQARNGAVYPADLQSSLGEVFESYIKNAGTDFHGVMAESSTVYLRHPYKNQA